MTIDEYMNNQDKRIKEDNEKLHNEILNKFKDRHIYVDAQDEEWIFFKEITVKDVVFSRSHLYKLWSEDLRIIPVDLEIKDVFYPFSDYLANVNRLNRYLDYYLDSRKVKFLDEFNDNWLYTMKEKN